MMAAVTQVGWAVRRAAERFLLPWLGVARAAAELEAERRDHFVVKQEVLELRDSAATAEAHVNAQHAELERAAARAARRDHEIARAIASGRAPPR